jgi:hypothetical protein
MHQGGREAVHFMHRTADKVYHDQDPVAPGAAEAQSTTTAWGTQSQADRLAGLLVVLSSGMPKTGWPDFLANLAPQDYRVGQARMPHAFIASP